ncbi:MAG: 23S rRNA (adenine(2503)-C(2))-methyltransferase RlmN, partial [Pseudomonadota bacterium]
MPAVTATAATLATGPVGLDRSALGEHLHALGVPERQLRMRTNQIWGGLYRRGAADYDAMTDLPASLRAGLAER